MCGICGHVAPPGEELPADVRQRMTDVLTHRGPDGEGSLTTGSADGSLTAWFGHRRLKVIDLSDRADQPMCSDDGMIALTYNGEIYNFREVAAELRAAGHEVRSSGDTEVVLRAYEAWGDAFVERLDGMFALGLWDGRRGKLVLARDRTGKKPLFYTARDGRLAFASEPKALLACPWADREPDWSRLGEYLVFGYVPTPNTLLRGVMQVPPGCTMTFDAAGLSAPRPYWDPLPDGRPHRRPSTDVYADIRRLTREATARRMISDVPLGALLSGGIDSSIIVGLMSELAAEPVHTFSIGFADDASFDERSYARTVAEHFGTRHTEFVVDMDAVGLLDRLLWHHDLPFHDSSAVPTFIVSQLAREHVTVVLNGDGGDEVFGGYDRFVAAAVSRFVPRRLAGAARRGARLLPRNAGYYSTRRRIERFLELADAPMKDRYLAWVGVFRTDELPELLRPGAEPVEPVTASMDRRYAEAAGLPQLDQVLYANFKTYLPDDLAVKMDRMSMANSLEARSPFLDTALIDYVAHIPASRKVGLRHVKPVLRNAFRPMLPDEIWNRKKHGFGPPLGAWFRGELGTRFGDEVLAVDARSATLLDQGALGAMFAEHQRGEREHGVRLWAILTLERWLRNLEEPVAVTPPALAGVSAG